jgi:hypothetical protein
MTQVKEEPKTRQAATGLPDKQNFQGKSISEKSSLKKLSCDM